MTFTYFENPGDFAYMADGGQVCHFCQVAANCLDGSHFFGAKEIGAVCFSCMQKGCLIELDISANEIDVSLLNPSLIDVNKVANEIRYCTPSVPTWQESFWPIKHGRPYKFIKIASKIDYESKEHFIKSLYDNDNDNDPEWLWEMLPGHRIANLQEGQYDLSCYLYDLDGDILTTWDAN